MARICCLIALLATLLDPALAPGADVHPTERDEILKAVGALASATESQVEAARQFLLEKDAKAVPFLLDALKRALSEAIRIESATLLGELRDASALTPLFVTSQVDASARVRMAAQLALDQLVADLKNPRLEDTRHRAYEQITREAINELRKVLRQGSNDADRVKAAQSLGTYGSERELSDLHNAARRDTSVAVRIACYEAIRRITYPLVLARDFQALSWDPARRPRNPVAVVASRELLRRFLDEKDADVKAAIVENLAEIVYPVFLLGERRFRSSSGALDDHRKIIEEVTDLLRRDLANEERGAVLRAEIRALTRLLSAYYRVGDVDVQDEIRRRITSDYRRVYLEHGGDYRSIIVRTRFDRFYRTTPPKNDVIAGRFVAALLDLYKGHPDSRVRLLAAEGVGLFGDRSDAIAITRGFAQERNAEVLEAGIVALGLLDRASSATYLFDNVYSNVQVASRLRLAAAQAIGRINYPRETRRLAALLTREPNKDVLLAGIVALSYSRNENTAQTLVSLLDHDDAQVRVATLEALRYNPHRAALARAEALLAGDADALVRAASAATLAVYRGEAALPALVAAVKDESPDVRRAVVIELGLLKSSKAVDVLIGAATTDPDPDVRIEAAASLGQIRDQKAIEPLVQYVQTEPEPENRRAIYDALLAMRQPNTVIVSMWAKLPALQKDNAGIYLEFQEVLLYLQDQKFGYSAAAS
ncbi:MAG: HEAT repeat domain-containing protein [Verrucomicrobia bacterium]|nr:HEAT repeat domain-containing protein [Verrucomicrobiota bacterium]